MKITSLELKNFRSYRDLTIPMDAPRVLVSGLNGSGKTGIKNSLRWLLTGHCEGTDAKGSGAEVLIPSGSGAVAEVAATIASVGTARRSYAERGGGSFTVDAFTGTSQIQHQALCIKLQTTPEYLDAVLDTETFLNLNHIEAKALVLSLLGVKIPVGEKSYTLDELDVRYKQAFEDRKAAKKILQNLPAPVAPETKNMPPIAAIDAQLQTLRTALGALQKAVGQTAGRRQVLEQEWARVASIVSAPIPADRKDDVTALEQQIAALESEAVPPAPTVPPKAGDPTRAMFLKKSSEAIAAHLPKSGCVFDAEIPCKTPQKAFTDRAEALLKEVATLAPAASEAAKQAPESPLTTLRREFGNLRWAQQKRDAAVTAHTEAVARQAEIRKELDALPSTETQDAEILTIHTRIQKGEQLLKDARVYFESLVTHETAVQKHQAAKTEVDRLETLVETLGPNGVRVQALKDALGRFEAAVNPYVQPFGWTLAFQVEPWQATANGRPVETYSRSERFRIGIALQMGIALLSELRFCVVDEVDMLDAANRGAVTKMLLSAPLEQIIILGTREPSQALPDMDGLIAYRIGNEHGKTVVIEQTGAAAAV